MYYDVVRSEYEGRARIDSHLICGGFDTEDDAKYYINTHDCECGCVEIEEHNEDGTIACLITVNRYS